MSEDLVSVIVPSYNYEKYIIECLQSIVNQDYEQIELIIVDDFSKDNSRNLIKKFIEQNGESKRFVNIKYIENTKNEGAHYTINRGIQQAEGRYIAVINADDLYEKNRFSAVIPKMKKENANIAFSNIEVINGESLLAQGEEAEGFRKIQIRIDESSQVSYALMIQNVSISTGNMIFTKELYNKLGGFKEYKYIHDWDFILRAALIEEPLYIKETKYYYRLHNENSFRDLGDIADQEVNLVLNNFFNEIRKGNVTNEKLRKDKIEYIVRDTYLNKYWKKGNRIKDMLNRFIIKLVK